jgi:hypothetical protein
VNRTYPLTVTVPAGTSPNTPLSVPYPTEDNDVVDIEILIPAGHCGLTGIRVMWNDRQILPWGVNDWIIANDYHRVFPVGQYLLAAGLRVEAYNMGLFPHSFYLRAQIADCSLVDQQPVNPIASVTIPGSDVVPPLPLSPDALLAPDDLAAAMAASSQPAPADLGS